MSNGPRRRPRRGLRLATKDGKPVARGRRKKGYELPESKRTSLRPSAAEPSHPTAEFIVPVTDSQGHAAPVSCRIPPQMKRELQKIVSSRVFPFETESDLTRYCLKLGLASLNRRHDNKHLHSFHSIVADMLEAGTTQMDYLRHQKELSQCRAIMQKLVDEGAIEPAKKLYRHFAASVAKIDDTYWRNRYKKDLLRTYRWVERQAEKRAAKEEEKKRKDRTQYD